MFLPPQKWGRKTPSSIYWEDKRKIVLKMFTHILFALFTFFTLTSFVRPTQVSTCKWNITFSDHFDGQTLNTSKWSTRYASGGGGERQYYASDAFKVKNSLLNINATEALSHGYPYTSGIITTQPNFAQQYGRFVIRAKLPNGKGFWPAFWLLPVNRKLPGEIDVFEMLGKDPRTIFLSNHWKSADGIRHHKTVGVSGNTDFSAGFHTFEIDWSPSKIVWYIDGIQKHQTDQMVPSVPMFMLINLAVGGTWPGNPDMSTQFPGTMQIDYVRVYAKQCEAIVTNPQD